MSTSERTRNSAADAASWQLCQERQDLLARLKQALDDFGTAVQESRARDRSGSHRNSTGSLRPGVGGAVQASGRTRLLAATGGLAINEPPPKPAG